MKNWYLYLLVFIAGAAVLAVEILGTRILGPFYGVSLFLWSALITVTLAALSVGYALGGRWADRGPQLARLCYLLASAGVWLLFTPLIRRPVLVVTEPLGLRVAVLVATLILFAPPLTLLGMVSPYAIRLKAVDLSEVGRTAGDVYAISTVGSVIAALATGFILIPSVGVMRLTFFIGAILILSALLGLLKDRGWMAAAALALGTLAFGSVGLRLAAGERADPESGLLAVEQSAYAEIRVLDLDGTRHLLIDGGVHTMVDPSSWASYFPYVAVVQLTQDFFEWPGRLLLIGLGGGTIAKDFARVGWTVDAVEIDPAVVEVARDHFGLTSADGQVYSVDGREFLIRSDESYDLIVLDAFGSSSIPFHLVTKESFGLIAARLKPDGILAMNVESLGWDGQIVRSLAATLRQHFARVLALPTEPAPDQLGNLVLLASNGRLVRLREGGRGEADARDEQTAAYARQAWARRFVPNPRGAPVLTDDLNPVDLWSEQINYVARKDLHQYFETSGRSW